MRVLLLSTSFPLTNNARSGIFVKHLADYLAQHADIEVLTPDSSANFEIHTDTYPVHVFRYAPKALQQIAHGAGGIPQALSSKPWLYALLPFFLGAMFYACWRRARSVDLIHANWSIPAVIAGVAGRLSGRPMIATLRGSDIERAKTSRLELYLLRLCGMLSFALVTVSESLKREVMLCAPQLEQKIAVIPNGVDPAFYAVTPRRGGDRLRALVVANLIADKGVAVILRALVHAPHVDLRIVGDGPLLPTLRTVAASLNLTARIEFVGALAPQAMPGVFATADVYVSASRHEGRSNALLEAMAAGCAIVASRIPGNEGVVTDGETGILFPVGSDSDLGRILNQLDGDRLRVQELGAAAQRHATEQGWTWDNTATRYLLLYRRAMAQVS